MKRVRGWIRNRALVLELSPPIAKTSTVVEIRLEVGTFGIERDGVRLELVVEVSGELLGTAGGELDAMLLENVLDVM